MMPANVKLDIRLFKDSRTTSFHYWSADDKFTSTPEETHLVLVAESDYSPEMPKYIEVFYDKPNKAVGVILSTENDVMNTRPHTPVKHTVAWSVKVSLAEMLYITPYQIAISHYSEEKFDYVLET